MNKKYVSILTLVASMAMPILPVGVPMASAAQLNPNFLFTFPSGIERAWNTAVQGDMLWVVGTNSYGCGGSCEEPKISLFKLADSCPPGTTPVSGTTKVCAVTAVQGLSLGSVGLRAMDVAVDANGNAYVDMVKSFSSSGGAVAKVTPTGTVTEFKSGFYQPYNYHGIAVYNDILYKATGKVYPAFGTLVKRYNLDGTSAGSDIDLSTATGPTDLSISGGILCVSGSNVPTRGPWCFDMTGSVTNPSIQECGGQSGQTIDFDPAGHLYCIGSTYQYGSTNVAIYGTFANGWIMPGDTSQLQTYFTNTNATPGQNIAAWGVSVSDSQQRLFVGSFTDGDIRVYDDPLVSGPTDTDGDGVTDDQDDCDTVVGPGDRNGCPFADVLTFTEQKIGFGPATVSPVGGVQLKVFNKDNPAFIAAYPGPLHNQFSAIWNGSVGQVGSCTTDVDGLCVAGEEAAGNYLVVGKFVDAEFPNSTVYVGKSKSTADFVDGVATLDLKLIKKFKKTGVFEEYLPKGQVQYAGAPASSSTGNLLALAAAALAAGLGIGVYARRK